MRRTLSALAILAAATTTAQADISVRFSEGAPKDRFTFTNAGSCALTANVTLDLAGSAAGLIFDTTGSGAGVEVFQPFEVVSGRDALATLPQVTDGDTSVTLAITALPPGKSVAFTIDVDDTMGGREITVNGSEIAGATVQTDAASAPFTAQATATLPHPGCTS